MSITLKYTSGETDTIHEEWHINFVSRIKIRKTNFSNFSSIDISDDHGNQITIFFKDAIELCNFIEKIGNTPSETISR